MTMADTHTTRTSGEHGRVRPILIVALGAIVAFVVALVAFRGGGSSNQVDAGGQIPVPAGQGSGCGAGKADPAYAVSVGSDPNPPRVEGTTFHLTVRHDGKAVTGAKVCVTADMTEMHHEGIDNEAKEASGGRYDTTLRFAMRGPYGASVSIVEPGKAVVSVPITFQVS